MKQEQKDYIEAAALIFALDNREEAARQVIRSMSLEERRRFHDAMVDLCCWIAQIDVEAIVGARPDGTFKVEKINPRG
jgi:hypothetical protein